MYSFGLPSDRERTQRNAHGFVSRFLKSALKDKVLVVPAATDFV
jgi:hypothetical protein